MADPPVRALTFDVSGTVVDWRGSVLRELRALGAAKGIDTDWESFVDCRQEPGVGSLRLQSKARTDDDATH